MLSRTASCSCGKLQAVANGHPVRISICHCLDCQRRSGGVFAIQARFLPEQVQISGEGREYARKGGSGTTIRFTFCPDCGATLYYQIEGEERIAIPVGAFADPNFPSPTVSVYEERKHAWVELPAGIERFE
ncbi:GFA family protein [Pseudomarimonas arenosa]|uniref:GFA family protein n=1 Tax=Pseudomarimonas arenosa TaxID=2774145 RepID=A0AAW3ZKD2_9GAMM|nr:GFA family protein [Pseudomarimonas arenosa]MBD8526423.1 GFA family protein [Pseudomarimonas arenosa]